MKRLLNLPVESANFPRISFRKQMLPEFRKKYDRSHHIRIWKKYGESTWYEDYKIVGTYPRFVLLLNEAGFRECIDYVALETAGRILD